MLAVCASAVVAAAPRGAEPRVGVTPGSVRVAADVKAPWREPGCQEQAHGGASPSPSSPVPSSPSPSSATPSSGSPRSGSLSSANLISSEAGGSTSAPPAGAARTQSAAAYSASSYWDGRYAQRATHFDWFFSHSALRPLLRHAMALPALPALHVGCGNSDLSIGIGEDGTPVSPPDPRLAFGVAGRGSASSSCPRRHCAACAVRQGYPGLRVL